MTATAPFFMTHHSPVGAWASLTFGLPGTGVSIDHEALAVHPCADLLVAVSHGEGRTVALPFVANLSEEDYRAREMPEGGRLPGSYRRRWRFVGEDDMTRTLTPAVDTFATTGMALRVFTPHPALPDPTTEASLRVAACPGLLLELEVDNTGHDVPAHAFLGLEWRGDGRIRPLDWSTDGTLCGVGLRGTWALAARHEPGRVFTVRDNRIAAHIERGTPIIHNGANEGGILMVVPAGERAVLRAAFGWYHAGMATQGVDAAYWYTQDYARVEEVCAAVLDDADAVRDACAAFDAEVAARCPDAMKRQFFAQAVRGYAANGSLLVADGHPLFSVCEGQFCWRNTLDLAADHLPWDLARNPWIVRALFEQYLHRYSYQDSVTFPDEDGLYPAGMAFAHDMGSYTAYSRAGHSGYEMPHMTGCYSYMSTEQLLNGIYLAASYGLVDDAWRAKNIDVFRALLESLELRDHHNPARRDGLLKGESTRCGANGAEITTYDALDHALQSTRGNLYIATKAWCAAMLLAETLARAGDADGLARAERAAGRFADALITHFDAAAGCFPPNLLAGGDSRVIAALEPLAVPAFLGLSARLHTYDELLALLRRHADTCLQPGVGLDATAGGLKLSSGSTNTWPSKSVLCAYVLEAVLGVNLVEDYPTILRELRRWTQEWAKATTIADQILLDSGRVSGAYYPRHVTSAVWTMAVC